jgi:hypothetical protein
MAEHWKDGSGQFYTHKPASDPAHQGKDLVSYGDKSGHTTLWVPKTRIQRFRVVGG